MLTQLDTVKARLAIDLSDPQYDTLLNNAIAAISTRFDKETNRTLLRTENATDEFGAAETEILVSCYPIEGVSKFETKDSESDGWIEQADVEFLLRRQCVVSLADALGTKDAVARITYTGGYVAPGATPDPGQIVLPSDLEQAAVEQVASWFLHRDKVGLLRSWPHQGTYEQFSPLDFLPSVKAVLARYERFIL